MGRGKLYDLPEEVTRDSVESGLYVTDIHKVIDEAKKEFLLAYDIENGFEFETMLDWFVKWFGDEE